jgi:HSP20 family protein
MEGFKVKQASLAFSQIRMARHARKQQVRKHTRNKDEQPITSRYDPFRQALSLLRAMDQLFDQSVVNPSLMSGTPLIALIDVCETPNGYEVDIALPGTRPEDVEIVVDQNALTIRGRYSYQNEHEKSPVGQVQGQQQRQTVQAQGAPSQQQGQPQQGRMERQTDRHRQGHNCLLPSGTFERTITFPRPIDVNTVHMKRLRQTTLSVSIPYHGKRRSPYPT